MYRLIILFCVASFSLFGKSSFTAEQAGVHIGETTTVCGKVTGAHYAKKSKGKPTFINLDGRYPNHIFTILIWDEDREKFNKPEKRLESKRVCATGLLELYRGIPEIVVREKQQLKVYHLK